MWFVGYHGTSEASAQNIIATGVRGEALPTTGQIGPGFYIARSSGALPNWAADWATQAGRSRLWAWQRWISAITGERNNPTLPNDAKRMVLKVFTTKPLVHCKWGIMNPVDLHLLKAVLDQESQERGRALDVHLKTSAKWLQMVIPPEELQFLSARRDDGRPEVVTNWLPKESPI